MAASLLRRRSARGVPRSSRSRARRVPAPARRRPPSWQSANVVLGEPAVELFEQRLRLRRTELAKRRQRLHRDRRVHHLALKARVVRAVLQVVVDRLDQVGDVAAEDAELVDRAVLRHIAVRHQLKPRIVAPLDRADPHQLVEHRARRHVAAVALDQHRKARLAVDLERTRPAARVEKLGVTRPAGQDARGAVVALEALGAVEHRVGEEAVHFLAGQPREHRDPRGRRLLAGQAEVLQRDIDIDPLGHVVKRAERDRMAQQQPAQRPQQLLEGAAQGALMVAVGIPSGRSRRSGCGGAHHTVDGVLSCRVDAICQRTPNASRRRLPRLERDPLFRCSASKNLGLVSHCLFIDSSFRGGNSNDVDPSFT